MNIGDGYRISINDLATHIKNILNSAAEITYENKRAGDVKDSLADINKAESLISFKDQILLKDGLEETISYYQNFIKYSSHIIFLNLPFFYES